MSFTQQIRADGAGLVVALYGEMDVAVSGPFEATVHRLIVERRPSLLHIDLSGLRFLDSTGVSVLVRLWRLARREHCSLRVVNPTGPVHHVLEITGALAIVGSAPTAEAAPGVTP
jgi:anti-sigma B factor antagonist